MRTPGPRPEDIERVRATYGLPRRYVLTVGTVEPRKNIPFLVDAFLDFRRSSPAGGDFQLALAGGSGYRGEEIAGAVRDRGLEPAVRLLGYVPDEDLPALYRGADLQVTPSLYEGFGLPAAEAMACGTPVIATTGGALPEVVGNAGMLVRPASADALADAIGQLLNDQKALQQMSEAGKKRVRAQFNWEQAARKTLEVYQEVLATR